MATTVSHRLPTAQAHAIAQLTGYEDPDVLRWQQACIQASHALHPQPESERLAKALALAQDGAVTLEADGTAAVTSGKASYHVQADGTCTCLDAQYRGTICKHRLAAQIHQQALALLAPSAAPELPAAPQPASATRQARPRRSAGWDVHEAPVSSCFRMRVGTLEWMHTIRASDDAELQTRLQTFLPTFRAIAAALEALHAEREAAKAAPAPQPPAPTANASADLQVLIQQAVQQALAAQASSHSAAAANGTAANGTTASTPPPAAPSPASEEPTGDDQATGVCSLHQVAMKAHTDPTTGDTWSSHWDEAAQRYCRGRRPRRPGRTSRR
jgi:hypothetical protein